MATPTYTPIATTTLASATSSVSFFGITQDFRDLVIVFQGGKSGTSNGSVEILPNGDSSNGSSVFMFGTGSVSSSTSSSVFFDIGQSDSLAIVQVMDYSATDRHKMFLTRSNYANSFVGAGASRWADTSAIETLIFKDALGGFDLDAGTTISIYGIAGVV